ncbi:MAG TPA: response regulator [bacterium]|nr:response regulator [bacterium]
MDHGIVLIVDDNAGEINLLGRLLREQGYRINIARSGQQALVSTAAEPPDCILLDIGMPDLDGFAVCAKLKADNTTAAIPVIFITGHTDDEHITRAFTCGGQDYITKPFRQAELFARVRQAIELYRLTTSLNARVQERTAECENARLAIARKHAALQELFDQVSREKQGSQTHIAERIDSTILPIVRQLEHRLQPGQRGLLLQLTARLHLLAGRTANSLDAALTALTAREHAIAALVRSGHTGKEIGAILNITEAAVKFHCGNIRRKIGVAKGIGLAAHLNRLARG